jgi:hypothetical protein
MTTPICKCFTHVVVGIAVCAFSSVPRASAAVNVGSSSWVWQNPLPQGNSLQGVACSSAGGSLSCIAVRDLGTIIFGTAGSGGAFSWTSRTSNTTQTSGPCRRSEFIKSRGNRRLVQPATVLLPAIRSKADR